MRIHTYICARYTPTYTSLPAREPTPEPARGGGPGGGRGGRGGGGGGGDPHGRRPCSHKEEEADEEGAEAKKGLPRGQGFVGTSPPSTLNLCSACVCRCASTHVHVHVHVYVCAREAAYTAMAEEDLWVAYIDSQRDNVGYKFILRVVVEIN